jgi:rare lipoprotein A
MGPEVACGSGGSPTGSSYNYRSRERVYAGDSERRSSTYRAKERYATKRPERRKAPVRVASVNPRSEEHVTADAAPMSAQKKVAAAAELPQEPKAAAEASSIATKVAASRPTQSGMASYYGTESGSQTASGARFIPSAMTAAHRTLPFGTKVLVTNKSNGRSVVVTINDRGPFVGGRIIDLSAGRGRGARQPGSARQRLSALSMVNARGGGGLKASAALFYAGSHQREGD